MTKPGKIITLLITLAVVAASLASCGIFSFRDIDGEVTVAPDTSADTGKPESNASETTIASDETLETIVEQTEQTQAEETTAAETVVKNTNVIKFIATGDNIIHESVYTDAKNRATDGGYNFFDMYAGIYDFVQAADIAFVNQETPIAGASFGYYGYPNFNGPDEAGDALVKVGFNVVNVASNHMLDMKTEGLSTLIDYWNAKDGITVIGGYKNSADYDDIRVTEYGGVKIAWLSYTYGTNGMTLDSGSPLIVPLFDDATIIRQLALAKQAGDLVFVSCHWGDENSFTPSSTQKHYAQLMADNGADVIIGHHTHTIQPVEYITGSGGNQTLVIYSLGNMISTMYYGYNMVGGFITFDIVPRSDGGKPAIENVKFVPTVTHYSMNRDGLQVYLLDNYTKELAAAHGCTLNSPEFTLERAWKYVTDNIVAEFLD